MLTKTTLLSQQTSGDLMELIRSRNQIQQRLLSAKNFENLLLHSLNAQDYVLNLNSETIYELITQLKDNNNRELIAVARPADIDPLYIILKDIKEKAIKKREPKFNLKIKTRLLCDQKKP